MVFGIGLNALSEARAVLGKVAAAQGIARRYKGQAAALIRQANKLQWE